MTIEQLAMEVNRAATRMLADVARGCGVRRFVFASSCGVYGASDFCLDETSAVNPLSVYAQTKVDSEDILLAASGEDFTTDDFAVGDFVWAFAADAVRFGGEFICGAGGLLREDYGIEWGPVASFPTCAGCGAGGGGVSGGGDQRGFGRDF